MKKLFLSMALLCLFTTVSAQVFETKNILYSTDSGFSGWYTESVYSPIDSHNDSLYFIMLDASRKPMVAKYYDGETTFAPLDNTYPDYKPLDDGHQEYSIGVDKEGYIHVAGDLHNFPQGSSDHVPVDYQSANILYWKSSLPGDISSMEFKGNTPSQTIPGLAFSYGNFTTDRNGELYYVSRTLAREFYYQNGGRGLGLYWFDTENQAWVARGTTVPKSDASFPVIAWEESGRDGGSYQQFKGNIRFDANNRMHLTVGMNTENGPAQVNSIIYAYSDDGGVTFHRANGDLISLPMQVASGPRQADVIDSDPLATYEQPSLTYAFNNQPVIHYTASGSHYYQYWDGSAWSGRKGSPIHVRGKLLFNTHTNQLLFININDGSIHAKTSFEGPNEFYDAGETFRYYDIKTFYKKNVLNGISWKTSTGKFEVVQLRSGMNDCHGDYNGSANIDDCGICSGGNTGVLPCVSSIQAEDFCELMGDTETIHSGFIGESYINSENLNEANALWSLNAANSGNVQLTIRYANGANTDRSAEILNFEGVQSTLNFSSTGAWNQWSYLSLSFPFTAGVNVLELKATTADGLPNIDQLSFSESVALEDCSEVLSVEGKEWGKRIFPNPTQGIVHLTDSAIYEVVDVTGMVIQSGVGNVIDLTDNMNGVYFLKIKGSVHRLVKQ